VGGAPSGRSRKQQNELDDPDAAPLEQNIKNLECDGVVYRVVKEIIDPQVHPINVGFIPHFKKLEGACLLNFILSDNMYL